LALDLGYQRKFTKHFAVGAAVQNLGTGLKYRQETAPLPLNIKLGLAYSRAALTSFSLWDLPTTFVLDFNLPNDNSLSVNFGSEYCYQITQKILVAWRFGVKTSHIFSTEAYSTDYHYFGTAYWGAFSFGLGISNENFALDYTFTPFYDLGSTHKISLGLKFGKVSSQISPEKPVETKKTEIKSESKLKNQPGESPVKLDETTKKSIMLKHYNRGVELLKANRLLAAKKEFEEVLKYDPEHQPSLIRLKKIRELLNKK
jgi:hypothetical protein